MTDIQDPNDINEISAKNTDEIQEAPDPDAIADPSASNGSNSSQSTGSSVPDTQKTYEDSTNTDESKTDPIIDEQTEDPTQELQIPADEFKSEMDKTAIDEDGVADDMIETIEDRDEDDDDSNASTGNGA